MINYTCRYYKAAKPCVFNKLDGSECPSCAHVSEFKVRVLVVKLDAMGDVLRSASMLPTIKARHAAPYITWITAKESLELVSMMEHVDEAIALSEIGLARVTSGRWDQVYSLSNDLPSASLASLAPSPCKPIGYYMEDGTIKPSNAAAERWLEKAAFDRLKRANMETYQRLMMAIIGESGAAIPRPALRIPDADQASAAGRLEALFNGSTRARVAINIGAGGRWPKKMLPAEQIRQLAESLIVRSEVEIVLLGGEAEIAKAREIMLGVTTSRIKVALTGSSVREFVALVNEMDVLICGDTLAMHIAAAVNVPTVAVFGPTSAVEIEGFDGLIQKIWAPKLDCLVCYGDCTKQDNCMTLLDLEQLIDLTKRQLSKGRHFGEDCRSYSTFGKAFTV